MKLQHLSVLALVALLAACAEGEAPLAPDAGGADVAPLHARVGPSAVYGSYIVVLEPESNPVSVAAIMGIHPQRSYEVALRGFAAELTQGQLQALRRNPNVAYVESDQIVMLAPPCGTPKGGPCPPDDGGGSSQVTPWGITRVGGPADGTGRTAWVIDSGIDLDHPDLNVDVARSANFVTRGKDSPDDGNGHGTHVAGTIAALDNDRDVVGVAAGATVVAVRVLDNSGSGTYSGVIAGVDYVAANGTAGDVANMSLGATGHFQSLHDAITAAADKGIGFAVAAGNESDDASGYEPAHIDHANVYTVSAIDKKNAETARGTPGP